MWLSGMSDEDKALIDAARSGQLAKVKAALDDGADVDAKSSSGENWVYQRSPLEWAASEGHVDVMKVLIEKGADLDDGAMFYVVGSGNIEAVKLLIKSGADVKYNDNYPLHTAVIEQRNKTAEVLIENGADADMVFDSGGNLLHVAVTSGPDCNTSSYMRKKKLCDGNSKLIELLLKNGADPKMKDEKGKTPLDIAKEKKQTNLYLLLSTKE